MINTTPIYDALLPAYTLLRQALNLHNFPDTPAQFNFEKHATWTADPYFVGGVMTIYFLFVFASFQLRPFFVQISKTIPNTLQLIFVVHNIILSAVSFILLLLIVENLMPRVLQNGLMWGLCHQEAYEADHRLEFYYYINYLLKYYELFDTFMLVMKGKKLEFLHWYHHSMTLFLCYTQLMGRTSISWVPIVLNLCVHVIMYYYYARTAISSKPVWWKKHLTTMQITQFVIDLVAINLAMYTILNEVYGGYKVVKYLGFALPQPTWGFFGTGMGPTRVNFGEKATCYGTMFAGVCGWSILSSYLLLFIEFFIATYKKKKKEKSN